MSVQHFTNDTFRSHVLESKGVVLVDFWAQWCGPCQMLGPVIEQLGSEMEGKAVVGKVDIDEQPELRDQYGIMSIPTLIVFKDGKEVRRVLGVQPKQALVQMIENA